MFDHIRWQLRQFAPESPLHIKQASLLRNSIHNGVWIETGTLFGQTTKFLSKRSKKIISIEPEPLLYSMAKKYFASNNNVQIINGTSESILPNLLPTLSGDINFWLDGHYSSGVTYKGIQDTPIVDELSIISKNIKNFNNVCIFIDDVRCFNESSNMSNYPSIDYLVDWARNNNLIWHIEHDIFCAKNKSFRHNE